MTDEADNERQCILEEFRNAAKRNNGRCLSRRAFEHIIPVRRWNKYWRSLRELQIDAGFAPNEMKSALPEEDVLGAWVSIISALKQYPSTLDLRYYLNQHNTSVSLDTLTRKFGDQRATVEKILEYCKSNNAPSDVLAICEEKLRTLSSKAEGDDSLATNLTEAQTGWVYLIKVSSPDKYKVGSTMNLERRLDEHSRYLADSHYEHTIKTDDPSGVEAYWHRRFKTRLLKGTKETFCLSPEDVRAFKRWPDLA
jgi:hypothetical protein